MGELGEMDSGLAAAAVAEEGAVTGLFDELAMAEVDAEVGPEMEATAAATSPRRLLNPSGGP